jgi:hypothetical protein
VTDAVRPLPAAFLDALQGQEEVLVSSREPGRIGTVPVWFAVGPPGVVYLFVESYSKKAVRWSRDPWVRLRVRDGAAVEGVARVVEGDQLAAVAPLIVERWDMAGATTVEALAGMVSGGGRVVMRVEAAEI